MLARIAGSGNESTPHVHSSTARQAAGTWREDDSCPSARTLGERPDHASIATGVT